jgi:3-deoxy-D-manno-octulosonic-acid transferase
MSTPLVGIFITFYSFLFELTRRLVLPLFAGTGRKKGWDIDKRNALPRVVRKHRSHTVVWVHAASLGEAKLLLQFLEVLEERNPEDCYVTTATSRAGVDYLEKMKRPSVYAVGFLPFDTLGLMKSLIADFNISRLWLLETELWPSMLWSCFIDKIPVGIANARIEEKSFSSYYRLRPLFGPLFRRFDVVLAQNESYALRFKKLGVRPECLHVVGNMKSHVQFHRAAPAQRAALRRKMNIGDDDLVLTAGCFHRGEGALLRGCLDVLKERGRAIKCVVVPRHLNECDGLAAELGGTTLRLAAAETNALWQLVMVEKLGILESMYAMADAAVIGGTFIDIGGHNVWEAARYCIPVFFGPHCQTQISGCEQLLAGGTGFRVNDASGLADGLEQTLWSHKDRFTAAQTLFVDEINRRQMVAEVFIP